MLHELNRIAFAMIWATLWLAGLNPAVRISAQEADQSLLACPTQVQDAAAAIPERQSHLAEGMAREIMVSRSATAVLANECFPFEGLEPSDRILAEKLLADALDSEALYTLIGGIKPVSEGFFSTRFRVDPPDLDELAQLSRVLRSWRCSDELAAGVLVFENLHEGERFASTWVASISSLTRQIETEQSFFGRLGLMPDSDPKEVLLSVERARDPGERWRGFGLLFGYPEFAVDFFVRAGLHQRETGEFVERDFRQYPTFKRAAGGLVYAVPQLMPEQPDEIALRSRVLAIQGYYRILRPQFFTDEQQRPLELIRKWFDDGDGWCHPHHAVQKVVLAPGLHLGIWTGDHKGENDSVGAKIRTVIPGSVADEAGLQVNDVVRSINDKTIQNAQEYLEQIATFASGQTVAFAIERPDGDNPTNHITISLEIPESSSLSEFLQESRDAVLER
ncbi:MAG: PDZ domain-containing protein [Pirellulaceae bacterium]|nr:PDZ domain-containing protein [Pirellulaceae bacterium]